MRVRSLAPGSRTEAGRALVATVAEHPNWQSATSVLLFAPLPDEPPAHALLPLALSLGKTLCLPRHCPQTGTYHAAVVHDLAQDLIPARFGIREPAPGCPTLPLKQLDLIFVPGVAFAADGARLGRGRGFYDRLLAEVTGEKVGMGFSEQVVPHIPVEAHDVPLDGLVTPRDGWLLIANRAK